MIRTAKADSVNNSEAIQAVALQDGRTKNVSRNVGGKSLYREFSHIMDKIAEQLAGSADFAGLMINVAVAPDGRSGGSPTMHGGAERVLANLPKTTDNRDNRQRPESDAASEPESSAGGLDDGERDPALRTRDTERSESDSLEEQPEELEKEHDEVREISEDAARIGLKSGAAVSSDGRCDTGSAKKVDAGSDGTPAFAAAEVAEDPSLDSAQDPITVAVDPSGQAKQSPNAGEGSPTPVGTAGNRQGKPAVVANAASAQISQTGVNSAGPADSDSGAIAGSGEATEIPSVTDPVSLSDAGRRNALRSVDAVPAAFRSIMNASVEVDKAQLFARALESIQSIAFDRNVLTITTGSTNAAVLKASVDAIGVKGITALSASEGNQNNAAFTGFGSQRAESQARFEKAARALPLPPQAMAKNLERVETVLKEAAKTRDGKTISLRLDPPDLGVLKIDVSLRDGALHARLSAESAQVNNYLRDRAYELQGMLRRLGLTVDRVTVAVSTDTSGPAQPDVSREFNQKQPSAGNPGQGSGGGSGSGSAGGDLVEAERSEGNAVVYDHWVA